MLNKLILIFIVSGTFLLNSCSKEGSIHCSIYDQDGLVDDKVYKGESRCDKNLAADDQYCDCVHRVE